MKRIVTCIFSILTISAFAGDFVKDAEPAILEVHYTRTEVTDTTKRESRFYKDPVMLRIGKNMSLFCGTKKLWSDSLGAINPDLELEIYFKTMDDNKKNGTHNLMGGRDYSFTADGIQQNGGKMRAAFGHKPAPEDFGKFVVNYDKEEIDYPHDL